MKRDGKIIYLVAVLALIAVFVFGAMLWLYGGQLTPAKIAVFRIVPLPMALVNFSPLPMNNFLTRFSVSEKILGEKEGQAEKPKIVGRLILESEISQLAAQRDLSASQKQIDDAYSATAQNAGTGANLEEYLAKQGLNEGIFKDDVLKPAILTNELRAWFYAQRNLNTTAYQLADSLLEKINSGSDMAELAAQYTQDETGKDVFGDMGYVQITGLAPELREAVSGMKVGDVKIIPGDFGIHIIRMEGQVGNLFHLRQILLSGSDFNEWFNLQVKNFKVINLLKV
jgi:hypothetical protein